MSSRSIRRSCRVGICTALVLWSVSACTGDSASTVDVLAASSFTDVAGPLEELIEQELGVDVRFSFGSSGSFLEQLRQGAPASVVITANEATMNRLEAADLVEPSVAVTRNELVIVVADTDAGGAITSLTDLAQSTDTVVVLCASSAPCGAATDELLQRAGVSLSPASREPNVRATMTKVLLGEADAAIVYRTEAIANPGLGSIELESASVSVVGQAAAVTGAELGAEIVEIMSADAAGEIFAAAGFLAP